MKKFIFLAALMAVFTVSQTYAAEDREGSASDNEYDLYDRNRDSADFNPDDYPNDHSPTYYQNYTEYPPGPGQPPQQNNQKQRQRQVQKQVGDNEYNLYDRNRDRRDFNQYDYPRSSDYYYPQ